MTPDMKAKARNLLLRHSKFHQFPYVKNGEITIGMGRSLSVRGVSHKEALDMLDDDIFYLNSKLHAHLNFYHTLDEVRQSCLLDLAEDVAINNFLSWGILLDAVEKGDHDKAAEEILNCKWASFSPERYQELAYIMRTGELV